MVRTVLGDILPADLGHTQCHEHIFLEKSASFHINPALCMDSIPRSLQELQEFRAAGGQTLVDAQPGGYGRNAQALAQLSRESGIYIVSVAGFHKKQFFESFCDLPDLTVSQLTDRFVHEICSGMLQPDGTPTTIRAGMLKGAFEPDGLTDPVYLRLFTAVVEAAALTGAPVMIHTEPNDDIFSLIRFFEDRGVPSRKLMICHLDRTHYDADYHRQVLEQGCYLCYDSVHRLKYVSQEQELALIRAIVDAGFDRQVVLSLDTTNQRLRSYNATDMGLDYILTDFIPALQEAGFSDLSIQRMCRLNAQSILNF